ncbi:hypothetical protein ABB37_08217 [Leptomonas pyrrhocoris]|uniref:Uncharacterized protein n=1 Tax=Leptomonas pyrrhocoris TaxID=157538 RepID=A0A0N0DSA9_LEPPY|nr:hypothetical protein ABB37_08217 [Leptomonas pyrrhocoris]KPA75648.1 hypothetical protein ABB37_08217 [Leptomonas pyrrhocoris]|eukprot:XP_015654087.1 hypothetical protein ABB37_08217 [Leptomonas pyrrhocoris]
MLPPSAVHLLYDEPAGPLSAAHAASGPAAARHSHPVSNARAGGRLECPVRRRPIAVARMQHRLQSAHAGGSAALTAAAPPAAVNTDTQRRTRPTAVPRVPVCAARRCALSPLLWASFTASALTIPLSRDGL